MDSLFNEENSKKILRSEMNFEFEKKEHAAKLEQAKKDVIAKEEKQKQKIIIISVSSGLVLVFIAPYSEEEAKNIGADETFGQPPRS